MAACKVGDRIEDAAALRRRVIFEKKLSKAMSQDAEIGVK
jgi:hypothetical protein